MSVNMIDYYRILCDNRMLFSHLIQTNLYRYELLLDHNGKHLILQKTSIKQQTRKFDTNMHSLYIKL